MRFGSHYSAPHSWKAEAISYIPRTSLLRYDIARYA